MKKVLMSIGLLILVGIGMAVVISKRPPSPQSFDDMNSVVPLDARPEVPAAEPVTIPEPKRAPRPDDVMDGSQTNSDIPASAPAVAPEPTTPVPVKEISTVKEFMVLGSNFAFSPSSITVKKGDTVKITFKNDDGFHDFRIDEFSVATAKIGAGKEEVVTFVANKTGSFEYYCSVGSHRAMGMKGTLVVE